MSTYILYTNLGKHTKNNVHNRPIINCSTLKLELMQNNSQQN